MNTRGVMREFESAAAKNIARMASLRSCRRFRAGRVLSSRREAARTGLPPESVDLILTSPPYCGAQKYARSLRLEMLLLGTRPDTIAEIDRKTLGTERVSSRARDQQADESARALNTSTRRLIARVARQNPTRAEILRRYIYYLHNFARECRRVLRRGGDAFVSFGTSHITGIPVRLDQLFSAAAQTNGLSHIATLVDTIPSRGLITRRHATAGRIDDERVVWLRG